MEFQVSCFSQREGIRQGDSICHLIFILFAEYFDRYIYFMVKCQNLEIALKFQYGPTISYLMYADDPVIYCKANRIVARHFMPF